MTALKGVKFNLKAGQMAPAVPGQVKNNAGGYVFKLEPEQQLRRFLVLGTDGGTYYQSERELTAQNAAMVLGLMSDKQTGLMALKVATEISEAGRAPRNQPALFVLALGMASPVDEVRRAAYLALPKIARTGYHLFILMEFVKNTQESFSGMGFRKALRRWYQDRPVDSMAYQLVKYRQREGWTHGDVLRLAKPTPVGPGQDVSFAFAAGKPLAGREYEAPSGIRLSAFDVEVMPKVIGGFLQVQDAGEKLTASDAVKLISEYNLPWEALPDHVKKYPEVWEALLPKMGASALIRQLPTMTRVGLVGPSTDGMRFVIGRLEDKEFLAKGRVHPFNVLVAQKTYASGASLKGSSTWSPVAKVVGALEQAFYGTFGNVPSTGARIELDLDVSSSMVSSKLYGLMSAREASAAMALVTMNAEEDVQIFGFVGSGEKTGRFGWGHYGDSRMLELDLDRNMMLHEVMKKVEGLPFGRTDCSLPMLTARKEVRNVDTFVIYTDNETWAGKVHPFKALQDYRQERVAGARLVTVGMTATGFSIADPNDAGMLDVVGFDSAAPSLISSFVGGEF